MYNTLRWFMISMVLFVSANAIVSYPAKAFERDNQGRQLMDLSLQSFAVATATVQQDVRPTGAPNFSINYSDRRNEADGSSTEPSDRKDLTWRRRTSNDNTGSVSIPEPSALLGLIGVSTLFAFKRKSVRKA
jgi:hypothetical protein